MSHVLHTSCASGTGEKLFWLDVLPQTELGTVVDFGCGTGHVLKAAKGRKLKERSTIHDPVYIDHDEELIAEIERVGYNRTFVSSDPAFVSEVERSNRGPSVLLLSSVLHEIESHLTGGTTPMSASKPLFSAGFDYVVVRDFCRSLWAPQGLVAPRVLGTIFKRCADPYTAHSLSGGIYRGGVQGAPLDDYDVVEMALKSRWADGIDRGRELSEHYFAVEHHALDAVAGQAGYHPVHVRRFKHPHVQAILNEMAITLDVPTHIEAVYKLRQRP